MVAYPNQAGANEPAGDDTSDEQMLEKVRMGMGNQEGPPPGSGMKWQDLQEDQDALEADPSPENVQAFVQYWGQENLPPDLQQQVQGGPPQGPPQGAPPQGAPPMPPGR
jgi:hypothetical protein